MDSSSFTRTAHACVTVIVLLHLTGCSLLAKVADSNDTRLVAAAELDQTLVNTALQASTADARVSAIGAVVQDSSQKCAKFMNGLVLISNTTNSGFDMATTLFTALATAFHPIGTVHSLAAAGSISSGWKTAIDSDIYAKATAGNYAQAIQASYFQQLSDYVSGFEKIPTGQIVSGFEITKIRAIHFECSLAAAQSAITATIGAAQTSNAQTTNSITSKLLKVSVNGAAVAGDAVTLTARSSSSKPPLDVTVSYSVKAGDSASAIAHGLYGALIGAAAADLKNAGVTVQLQPVPNDDSIVLSASSAAIQWTASNLTAEQLALSDWSAPASEKPDGKTAVPVPGSPLAKPK
jgi:hypothetical protein